jgi:hypothetical protein
MGDDLVGLRAEDLSTRASDPSGGFDGAHRPFAKTRGDSRPTEGPARLGGDDGHVVPGALELAHFGPNEVP